MKYECKKKKELLDLHLRDDAENTDWRGLT